MTTTPRIPGPSRAFPLRTLAQFRRDPIAYLRRLSQDYGTIARFRVPGSDLVVINDPDHIRDILVTNQRSFFKGRGLERAKRLLGEGLLTSEGDFHLRQRRMIQPSFHRQRIVEYGREMSTIAAKMAGRWSEGSVIDIGEEAAAITLMIVGKTLFNTDVEGDRSDVGEALNDAMKLFGFLSLPGARFLEKMPLPAVKRFKAARAKLDATIFRIIDEHKDEDDQGDLLSMLLAARDDEEDGAHMTVSQVRDEAMTLFIAGHETTATSVGWTLYLLSQYPDIEAKLAAEVKDVLGDRLATVDDLPSLKYTRQVIAESLRLYPPGWLIGRRALVDYPVGGYVIPKGSIAVLAPVVTQVDPRFWPDPMRFDPDRWASTSPQPSPPEREQPEDRPKFAYFPFGGGPRICIGENFAWMELILVMSTLIQRWRFALAPDQKVETAPIITLRSKNPIMMQISTR